MALRLSSGDIRRLAKSLRDTSFFDFPEDFGVQQFGATYYLHDAASGIATYSKLLREAPSAVEDIDTVTVKASDGQKLIEAYATDAGDPDALSISNGTWEFDIYSFVDNANVGTTTMIVSVYKRTAGGVETLLFTATSARITNTAVQLNPLLSTQQQFSLAQTDRLVAKFYARTTSVPNRIVSLVHDGTAHFTHFHTPIIS